MTHYKSDCSSNIDQTVRESINQSKSKALDHHTSQISYLDIIQLDIVRAGFVSHFTTLSDTLGCDTRPLKSLSSRL